MEPGRSDPATAAHSQGSDQPLPDLSTLAQDPTYVAALQKTYTKRYEDLVSELQRQKIALEAEIARLEAATAAPAPAPTSRVPSAPAKPNSSATRALETLCDNYLNRRMGLATREQCSAFFTKLLAANDWIPVKPSPLVDFMVNNDLVQSKVEDGLYVRMW